MKLDTETLEAISRAETDGNRLVLVGQLEPKAYKKVAAALIAAGGKWNRKEQATIFDGDAAEAIEPLLLTGEVQRTKQDFGQFDTPPELAARMVEAARISPGMKVLEPSCGVGNLIEAIVQAGAHVMACEIDQKRHAFATERFKHRAIGTGASPLVAVGCADFMTTTILADYDRVVMNPPFAKQADIAHVMRAAQFLKPGGRLVSIMSAGVVFRSDLNAAAFRHFLTARDGVIEPLPEGSFKTSGTAVNTVMVSFGDPS